jgi:hypothetical protein
MSAALPLCAIRQIVLYALHFVLLLIGLAVFADATKSALCWRTFATRLLHALWSFASSFLSLNAIPFRIDVCVQAHLHFFAFRLGAFDDFPAFIAASRATFSAMAMA